jgi:L-glutamine-phosphate cytidylyltransferase
MKAIVIAAGRGKRLGVHTEEVPKCMVQVGDRPMLAWQWQAMKSAGVEELVLIRGYKGDVLERFVTDLGIPARYVDNREWETNNILLSLACARHELDGPLLFTYSDIIYTPDVAQAVVAAPGPIALVVDKDFRLIYEGRTEHPLEEGEVSDLAPDGRIARVGKRALPAADAIGEFIGLGKVDADGARLFRDRIDALVEQYRGREDEPFQRAARFRNAYLTDLLQDLIDAGTPAWPAFIHGRWREIDTGQDLERARVLVESQPEVWS